MSRDNACRVLEGELPPLDDKRRRPLRRVRTEWDNGREVAKVRVLRRLKDGSRPTAEGIRNRTILQEMRRSYNQLTGVGDQLVDGKLSTVMSRKESVGTLGKHDLCTLNYDLAKLAASIFGPVVALQVYEHIGTFITERF